MPPERAKCLPVPIPTIVLSRSEGTKLSRGVGQPIGELTPSRSRSPRAPPGVAFTGARSRARYCNVLGEPWRVRAVQASGMANPAVHGRGVPLMCDYRLDKVASRPAQVGDKLVTSEFCAS